MLLFYIRLQSTVVSCSSAGRRTASSDFSKDKTETVLSNEFRNLFGKIPQLI